jgi:hypothetical protein
MAYTVDPARMALVEDVVRLHAEFGALLDRINDALGESHYALDPCQQARMALSTAAEKAMSVAVFGAAEWVGTDVQVSAD